MQDLSRCGCGGKAFIGCSFAGDKVYIFCKACKSQTGLYVKEADARDAWHSGQVKKPNG